MELGHERELIRATVRRLAEAELAPQAAAIDAEDRFPRDFFRRLGEVGALGVLAPEEYGGTGSDYLTAALVMEELARHSGSVALSYGAHAVLCVGAIARDCSDTQKRRFLPRLCSGEAIGAWALTESGSGSDALAMRSRAVKRAEDYVLEGSKTFITNGSEAGTIVVYARTDPEAGSQGISAFLVDADSEGFSCGRTLEKMGMRGSPTAELRFDALKVPVENRIGAENEAVRMVMRGLDVERATLAAISVGLAQAALDHALVYARERERGAS